VSLGGVVRLFRADPQHEVGAGGRMALSDHLRELRARILRSVLVMLVVLVAAFFFYDQMLALVMHPYNDAREQLGKDTLSTPVILGVTGPLIFQLKLCGLAALVLSSPYWLYQIWAFVVPGLHPHEIRWTKTFVSIAGPLFIAGVAVGYYVLPKGLQVLIQFTPHNVQNLVEFGEYFSFFTRMLLVFGVAFEIPLFVLLLNLAGILPARALADHRPWIILGVFVFAAVATPSTDPFSMCMLAIPMTLLFFASELIARVVERRRRSRDPLTGLADDEQSALDDTIEPLGPSNLSDPD
jgi:sec-independent protein translocase protein TatC